MACEAIKRHKISIRRAGDLFQTARKRIISISDKVLKEEEVIKNFALKYPHYGYRMIAAKLKLDGIKFNHKKVDRIYKKLELNLKKNKKSRKLPARVRILEIAHNKNEIWSMDFMSGVTGNGRKFRTLNVIDEWAREGLTIEVLNSINSKKVIEILEKLIAFTKRKPNSIRIGNGSEFTSYEFTNWAKNNNITLFYIQAGKPYQNCFIERFNGTYRNEILNRYIFSSIDEIKEITEDWLVEYNYKRPHSSLGGLPPKAFLDQKNFNPDLNINLISYSKTMKS